MPLRNQYTQHFGALGMTKYQSAVIKLHCQWPGEKNIVKKRNYAKNLIDKKHPTLLTMAAITTPQIITT